MTLRPGSVWNRLMWPRPVWTILVMLALGGRLVFLYVKGMIVTGTVEGPLPMTLTARFRV